MVANVRYHTGYHIRDPPSVIRSAVAGPRHGVSASGVTAAAAERRPPAGTAPRSGAKPASLTPRPSACGSGAPCQWDLKIGQKWDLKLDTFGVGDGLFGGVRTEGWSGFAAAADDASGSERPASETLGGHAEESVPHLTEAQVRELQEFWRHSIGVPPEHDRPLLASCRERIGRDLTPEERRILRKGFQDAVEQRFSNS